MSNWNHKKYLYHLKSQKKKTKRYASAHLVLKSLDSTQYGLWKYIIFCHFCLHWPHYQIWMFLICPKTEFIWFPHCVRTAPFLNRLAVLICCAFNWRNFSLQIQWELFFDPLSFTKRQSWKCTIFLLDKRSNNIKL